MNINTISTPKVLLLALSGALIFIAIFGSLYFWGLDHWVLTPCLPEDEACNARSNFFEEAGSISGSLQAITGLLGTLGLVLAALAVTMQSHSLALQNRELEYNRMSTRVANALAGISAIEFFKNEEAVLLEKITRYESDPAPDKVPSGSARAEDSKDEGGFRDVLRDAAKPMPDPADLQKAHNHDLESLATLRKALLNHRKMIYSELLDFSDVTKNEKVRMLQRLTA